ncbi:MAG: Flp family type IVb pilin [Acidimicrobiia bacterium]
MKRSIRSGEQRRAHTSDRGVSMVSYALLVSLIAMVGIAAIRTVGTNTSDDFAQVPGAFGATGLEDGGTTTTTGPGMTPKEKWDQAQADWSKAIDEANSTYQAALADANAIKSAQLEANKSLPKSDRTAANQQANAQFNASKAAAKDAQNAAKQAANDAKAAAQAEYKATK